MGIDILKILVKDRVTIEKFRANPLLIWDSKVENLSHFDFDQIRTKETKMFKGILFCFYHNRLEIIFRPHYYFNNNSHNANDFYVKDCIKVIQEFIDIFEIKNYEDFKIVNIEFGINLIVKWCIEDLITFLAYHAKNEFRTDAGLSFSKKSHSTNRNGTANTYKIIKAYAKGIQFPQFTDRNTFRFEVKSKKSRYINQLGIFNISDLLKPGTYDILATEINTEFSKVLILNHDTGFQNLSKREAGSLKEYLNPHTWYKILQNKKSRNNFNYHKKKFFLLLDKTGCNIHKVLGKAISCKLEELKISAYSPPQNPGKFSAYSPIYKGEICTKISEVLLPIHFSFNRMIYIEKFFCIWFSFHYQPRPPPRGSPPLSVMMGEYLTIHMIFLKISKSKLSFFTNFLQFILNKG